VRALVLEKFGQLALRDREDPPQPAPGEVAIRISFTGICGSDIHGFTGENGRRTPGQVMGHESVGRIYALGDESDPELRVGQVVTFNPLVGCGTCRSCRGGAEQHCPRKVVFGVHAHTVAAFAERVVVPRGNVVPLAGAAAEAHGALVEPLAVALHAARRAGITAGASVLVTGGGPIGQSVVLAARRLGATTVLATDVVPARRALCERLGATALDPSAAPVSDEVEALLGGPVDIAVDAVGVGGTMADALASTRLGGTVCLVGMGAPELTLPAYAVSTGERRIVGSFCYDAQTFRDAAAWVGEGDDVFDELITQVVPMPQAQESFLELAAGTDIAGKVLVDLRDDATTDKGAAWS